MCSPDTAAPRVLAGGMPFDADLMIPKDVWERMGPLAQATASAAGTQRALLARTPLLRELGDALSVADAASLGVTVLHAVGGDVLLGLCTLPRLDMRVVRPPKSELACTRDDVSAEPPLGGSHLWPGARWKGDRTVAIAPDSLSRLAPPQPRTRSVRGSDSAGA